MQEGLAVLTVPDACGSEEHCIGLCADDAIQMAWHPWKGDGNSRRLRLTRPEAMRLRDDGLAESAGFGAGVILVYRLQRVATPGLVRAEEEEHGAFPHPAGPPVADPGGATCRS